MGSCFFYGQVASTVGLPIKSASRPPVVPLFLREPPLHEAGLPPMSHFDHQGTSYKDDRDV